MPKRRKPTPTTVRLTTDDQAAMQTLADTTGWSFSKTLTFVVAAGWEALNDPKHDATARQSVIRAACDLERSRRLAAVNEADAAKRLRAAQAALTPANPHRGRLKLGPERP